ncbi:MAG TPA: hypothetical protein ENO14_02885, partial [Chromatiales bacterium]|nr:hypothetical protein [Chromatiales bacterium]
MLGTALPALAGVVAFSGVLAADPAASQTIEYLLHSTSQIRGSCATCPEDKRIVEDLQGTFDLTVMPIPEAYT